METKQCKRCEKHKPKTSFTKASRNTDGLQSYCKSCADAYRKEYQVKNPEAGTDRHYRRVFGITLQDVKQMLQKQDGKCALCSRELSVLQGRGFSTIAHVDHDHVTGKVRGILCGNCNTALGKLGDSIESIERVLSYLKRTTND